MKTATIYTAVGGDSFIILGSVDAIHVETFSRADARLIDPWFGGLNPRRPKGKSTPASKDDWAEVTEFAGALLKPLQLVEFEFQINGRDLSFKGGFALFGKKLVVFKRTANGKVYTRPFFSNSTAWVLSRVKTLSEAVTTLLEKFGADVYRVDDAHWLIVHGDRAIFSLTNRAYKIEGEFDFYGSAPTAQPKADRDIIPDTVALAVYGYSDVEGADVEM